jgi:hypothetical protein
MVSLNWFGFIGFENRRFGFFEDPGKIVMTSEERRFQKNDDFGPFRRRAPTANYRYRK